jgi:hypothetical protein
MGSPVGEQAFRLRMFAEPFSLVPSLKETDSKYPPAEPGALRCEPLKAASMRRLALSRFLSLLLHLFFP